MTNDAAERLCEYPDCKGAWGHPSPHLIEATAIDRRLAAERRATVERIRASYLALPVTTRQAVRAILDAEAER